MCRLAAPLSVALLLCAFAVSSAAGEWGDHLVEAGRDLKQLIRRNYTSPIEGLWSCEARDYDDGSVAFDFQPPGLELIRCVAAERAAAEFADGDAYVVMLSASADSPWPYKCKVCGGGWYTVDDNPFLQRPVGPQCGVWDRLELDKQRLPAGEGTRLDGVRCHSAYRKGCDPGYGWCRGLCCRAEALFYYPQLQQLVGAGKLLTTKTAGPREAPLLKLLTTPTATKTVGVKN